MFVPAFTWLFQLYQFSYAVAARFLLVDMLVASAGSFELFHGYGCCLDGFVTIWVFVYLYHGGSS